ncbi:MAG: hypothetical protein Q4G05_00240 [Clostridia bacterium]|nr:hypothetical protein [Clostridia bacterium]
MILALTKENEKLITEICKDSGYDEIQMLTGVNKLKDFAVRELKNLNNFNYIIIDINSTKESEDEIIKAVVAIKSMYNIRIIIMALGYKEGNSLLAKLFNEGIYNFVVGKDNETQKEELMNCLVGDGNQYKDAVRFRAEVINTKRKDRVIIKKEYKKIKQFETIGIVGTESHIGTTTQALLICSFLNSLKLNACYINANPNTDISYFEELGAIKNKNTDMLSYKNIDMWRKENTVDAMNLAYDFYIYDYGVFDESKIDNFISKGVKIVVSGTKIWEFAGLKNVFSHLEKLKDLKFLFNFTEQEKQKEWLKNMSKFSKGTYFTEYTPNPFAINVNEQIYHRIFKEYIAEKSSKIEIVDMPKNRIFGLFKRS